MVLIIIRTYKKCVICRERKEETIVSRSSLLVCLGVPLSVPLLASMRLTRTSGCGHSRDRHGGGNRRDMCLYVRDGFMNGRRDVLIGGGQGNDRGRCIGCLRLGDRRQVGLGERRVLSDSDGRHGDRQSDGFDLFIRHGIVDGRTDLFRVGHGQDCQLGDSHGQGQETGGHFEGVRGR